MRWQGMLLGTLTCLGLRESGCSRLLAWYSTVTILEVPPAQDSSCQLDGTIRARSKRLHQPRECHTKSPRCDDAFRARAAMTPSARAQVDHASAPDNDDAFRARAKRLHQPRAKRLHQQLQRDTPNVTRSAALRRASARHEACCARAKRPRQPETNSFYLLIVGEGVNDDKMMT